MSLTTLFEFAFVFLGAWLLGIAFAVHPQTRLLIRSNDQARDIGRGALFIGLLALVVACAFRSLQ